jgi:hypothetical protein
MEDQPIGAYSSRQILRISLSSINGQTPPYRYWWKHARLGLLPHSRSQCLGEVCCRFNCRCWERELFGRLIRAYVPTEIVTHSELIARNSTALRKPKPSRALFAGRELAICARGIFMGEGMWSLAYSSGDLTSTR